METNGTTPSSCEGADATLKFAFVYFTKNELFDDKREFCDRDDRMATLERMLTKLAEGAE